MNFRFVRVTITGCDSVLKIDNAVTTTNTNLNAAMILLNIIICFKETCQYFVCRFTKN